MSNKLIHQTTMNHALNDEVVQAACEHIGISPDDSIAFGDADNDLEMLEFVGCPIVVEGRSSEAPACTRFVTPTVDEALERTLDTEVFDW